MQSLSWTCSSCSSPPTPRTPQPLPIITKTSDGNPFTILLFNAYDIGNKHVELGEFLERHMLAVIQESKFSSNSRTPDIQCLTTVRKGDSLLTLIHKSINFSRKPESPETGRSSFGRVDYYGQARKHRVHNYQRLYTPASSYTGGYHLMMTTDTLILGDVNSYHSIVMFKFNSFERHHV